MNIHKNAKLTPLGRERMVQMMLDGHTPTKAAALAGVCPGTAKEMAGAFACRDAGVHPYQEARAVCPHRTPHHG